MSANPRPRSRPTPSSKKAPAPREADSLGVDNYREDPQFPRIEAAVGEILAHGKVVAPVDVLVKMELLSPEDLESWRAGGVPFLESVVRSRLPELVRLLRILRFYAYDLKLQLAAGEYVRTYAGQSVALRFTKSGEPKVEQAYSRHFVWPGKGPFRMPRAPRG